MLDTVGMLFGVAGAFILSSKRNGSKKEFIVFICFIISNIFLIPYSFTINSLSLIILNIIYLLISIKGIYKNFKKIKKEEVSRNVKI